MKEHRYGGLYEYQCHIGHRFGLKTMIAEKTELVERMLSAALAQSEELIELLKREQASGDHASIKYLDQELENRERQVQTLHELLTSSITESLG